MLTNKCIKKYTVAGSTFALHWNNVYYINVIVLKSIFYSCFMKIFIVEDDPVYKEVLSYHLSLNPDYEIKKFETGKECLDNLHLKPSVISIDFSLPDMDGRTLLKRLKESVPSTPVIVLSGQQDLQVAVDLLKDNQVYDYIIKDDDAKDRLWKSLIKINETKGLRQEIEILKEELVQKYDHGKLIKGNSEEIKKIFSLIEKTAKNNITVSITGETGTGKELVAKSIHYGSERSKKSFVAVNVAAIPRELIESELFGHEKGAFTGANSRRIGKFEEANKGTIFLDEIGEMDHNMQTKLLRVLQEKEVTRVGGNDTVKIDVRIIVATHKDLLEEVNKGNFRQDLYYRILGMPIIVPPLRARKSDILILARFFADEFAKENKLEKPTLSADAKIKLASHSYPGNVRELKAVMELATVMSQGNHIEADDITFRTNTALTDFIDQETTLRGFNLKLLNYFLEQYNNDISKVARKLDIGRSTVYRMLKEADSI